MSENVFYLFLLFTEQPEETQVDFLRDIPKQCLHPFFIRITTRKGKVGKQTVGEIGCLMYILTKFMEAETGSI